MQFVLLTVILSFFVHLLLAYNIPGFIPENLFPYRDILYKYHYIYPITEYGNFDGYQYISIAIYGYGDLQQSYFPLYPILLRWLNLLVGQAVVSGIIISFITMIGGLYFFKKLVVYLTKNDSISRWSMLFLVLFPTGYFYHVVYPESLYLFVSAAGLYFLYKKQWLLAAFFAVLASLTKVQAALLLIPYFLIPFAVPYDKNLLQMAKAYLLNMFHKWKLLFIALSPLYGLAVYASYLYQTTGDPLYFYHAQSAFGAERSVDTLVLLPQVFYRYIKIFLTADISFIYFISVVEFVLYSLVFGVICFALFTLLRSKKQFDLNQISLQLYSLATLILPTLTGTLTSTPRYMLISFGFFIALGHIRHRFIRYAILVFFIPLHIILFLFFLRGHFVS